VGNIELKWSDIPLFKGLNSAEIVQVICAGKVLKLQAGEYVFRAGDQGNEMYVIISGAVRVETLIGGSHQALARFTTGQIFGEIAFVANVLRTADIVATEELEILEISEPFFQELILKLPQTAAKILVNLSKILCERLANTTRSWIDSEYENILILFQTLALETEINNVFDKFTTALVKALPRIGAVELFVEGNHFLWISPGFEPCHPDFGFLEKQRELLVDETNFLTINPIKIKGRSTGYLLISQEPGAPLSAKELDILTKVSTQLGLVIDRILLNEETKALATIDPLTGLNNRYVFKKEMAKEINRARRFNLPISLLVADLDHFKKVNDTYGHLAGDETLRKVAALISESVRNIDIACRYGGEEFAVLLPMTDSVGALKIAERLRQNVEEMRIEFNKLTIKITISIGVATYQGESSTHFFERADQAAYQSKMDGRNRVSAAE
jgi:diguanylate cyclase (GGDEF)-like protein